MRSSIMPRGGTVFVRRKQNKYRNVKTEVDGIVFDSKKEAESYITLRNMQKAGLIKDLRLQPRYVLQEAFVHEGKKERKIEYIADFEYYENGERVVIDVKGKKTDVYKLKKKLFLAKYGKEVRFEEW